MIQSATFLDTMKNLLILVSLVGFVSVVHVHSYKTKTVNADFIAKQKKVLSLLFVPSQVDVNADYYKIGKNYNVEANTGNYTNKTAVEEFLTLYKSGFMPKYYPFSIFYEKQKQQAVALYNLFFYAKDFETFYETAAFARVYINEGIFLYAYYIAIVHRSDTQGIILPSPYEISPHFFVNTPELHNAYRIKMQGGLFNKEEAFQYGVTAENNSYIIYANYSDALVYPNDEYKLSYFTEDIGFNAFYYYYHINLPFWMDVDENAVTKERRGEVYFFIYQQLLARYYLERLPNGLGGIPELSWTNPIKTGFYPHMVYRYPFAQRPNDYQISNKNYIKELQFLDNYEKTFIQNLEKGLIKINNIIVGLLNATSINLAIDNYWKGNNSYDLTARRLLAAAPEPVDMYSFNPSALNFYQTSLRDPVFYQMYNRTQGYLYRSKQYVTSYALDLLYSGVRINDVNVDQLVTNFDYFDFDISNDLFFTTLEYQSGRFPDLKIRQPRLNNKPFTVTVDITSTSVVAEESVVKLFLGPKYNSNGRTMSITESWKYFVELDWSVQNLTFGQNKVVRSSTDFSLYKEDSISTVELRKNLDQGRIPVDMSEKPALMPRRLMLPRGTEDGFTYQLFVITYPYQPPSANQSAYFKEYFVDNKPLGYPFDRPANELYFKQPNMFFEDVKVYFQG